MAGKKGAVRPFQGAHCLRSLFPEGFIDFPPESSFRFTHRAETGAGFQLRFTVFAKDGKRARKAAKKEAKAALKAPKV